MKTVLKHNNRSRRGIGTVEVLLLLIGGILAFGWGFNRIKEQTSNTMSDIRMRQVAEEMVKISQAAEIAGVDLVEETSLRQTVDKIDRGATAKYGVFAGQFYGVKLDPEVKEKVVNFLDIKRGKLAMAEDN